MNHAILGKTDLSVSRLGYGAAPIGFLETGPNQIARVLNYLLDHGVNLIDTAACYRGSEEAIGEAISYRREDFVLVSKAGHAGDEQYKDFEPDTITASIDRSLKRLKTDHLDVLLLHSCDLDTLKKGDALGAVAQAVEQGKVQFAGYSGDNEAAAYAATLPDVSVIETSINLCDQANIETVLPICKEHDCGVIAKRPIANAAWKQPEDQPGMYKNYASEYHRRFSLMDIKPDQLGYSGHPEVEWPEIALKFTKAIDGVHSAICGTTSTVNAESNVAAVEKNPLRDEVVQKIRQAWQAARDADSDGDWSGQT
jgi:aryl-alcohol dehydrogenase-like predicted oxidoreductase